MLATQTSPCSLVGLGHAHDQAAGRAIEGHDAVPEVVPIDDEAGPVTLGGQPKKQFKMRVDRLRVQGNQKQGNKDTR